MERQIKESVLIERTSEVRAQCLNLKSEWAGSKIPGLSVSNPKGVIHKTGEEGKDDSAATFNDALRRGCKRLPYREKTQEQGEEDPEEVSGKDVENPDDTTQDGKEPKTKKVRIQGELGRGWEKVSPEKCKEAKTITAGQKVEKNLGPKNFTELRSRQTRISDFLKTEEPPKTPTNREREPNKQNTPVRRRVKRFEDLASNNQQKFKSPKLKTIRKLKEIDSRQGKVQACIKRFLEPNKEPFGASGTCIRPRTTATTSRLDPGTSPPEGGLGGEAKKEVRKGSIGPLDRWVRSMGPRSEALSLTKTAGERKVEDSPGLQEGGSKRKLGLKRWNKGKPCRD